MLVSDGALHYVFPISKSGAFSKTCSKLDRKSNNTVLLPPPQNSATERYRR